MVHEFHLWYKVSSCNCHRCSEGGSCGCRLYDEATTDNTCQNEKRTDRRIPSCTVRRPVPPLSASSTILLSCCSVQALRTRDWLLVKLCHTHSAQLSEWPVNSQPQQRRRFRPRSGRPPRRYTLRSRCAVSTYEHLGCAVRLGTLGDHGLLPRSLPPSPPSGRARCASRPLIKP